jgi:hypothetical protein
LRIARALVASLAVVMLAGCSAPAEQRLLSQFFAASRLRDLTALRKLSTIVFEPATDGIVTSFEITGVSGDGASKEVAVSAPVKLPDGRTVVKELAITITSGLVTAVSERPALRPEVRPASPSIPRP